jgi:hypothetical protein
VNAPEERREVWSDAVAIGVVHLIACTVVRASGFDHVSDDDFARVTIAQSFAVAPKLDPSGTSWLPAPFWILGAFMAVFGRTLEAARTFSVVVASAAFALPYLAARAAGVTRLSAVVASALMLGGAWTLWLGAATVPESLTASLATAGVIGITTRHRLLASVAILIACLSRYEAWPVAAAATVWLAMDRERRSSPAILVCALGPIAWMAWNIHAHGHALHFFHRVSTFKRGLGDGSASTLSAIALYPRLLVTTRPDLTLLAGIALATSAKDQTTRRRWLLPVAAAFAQLAFLAYGATKDGAPAHHPERALLGIVFLLAAFVGDAAPWRAPYVRPVFAAIFIATFVLGIKHPPRNDREALIARGVALRDVPALRVTPCAFEHFALIAAYGAPERVTVNAPAKDAQACPRVEAPRAPGAPP